MQAELNKLTGCQSHHAKHADCWKRLTTATAAIIRYLFDSTEKSHPPY
jgi:hypothetical protein